MVTPEGSIPSDAAFGTAVQSSEPVFQSKNAGVLSRRFMDQVPYIGEKCDPLAGQSCPRLIFSVHAGRFRPTSGSGAFHAHPMNMTSLAASGKRSSLHIVFPGSPDCPNMQLQTSRTETGSGRHIRASLTKNAATAKTLKLLQKHVTESSVKTADSQDIDTAEISDVVFDIAS